MSLCLRPRFLVAVIYFFLSSFLVSAAPNLLFILTDNHGAWTLGCYGNPEIKTPNIDKLAAEGILFRSDLSLTPTSVG